MERIEAPIGTEAGDEAVIDAEEVAGVALRADILDVGILIEEQEQPFQLEAQIPHCAPFHAEAGDTAEGVDLLRRAALVAGVVELGVDEGDAAGEVEQQVVLGPADAAARRREKVALEFHDVLRMGEFGLLATPVDGRNVALDTKDQRAHLPIPADLATAERA